MKIKIAVAALLLATPAAQANDAAHQGSARTANTLTQWNLGGFPVKDGKTLQFGKTETVNCTATAGCVLHMVLDVGIGARKTGIFSPLFSVDHEFPNPRAPFAATCRATDSCTATAQGTVAVARGTHKIEYGVQTTFDGAVEVWSAHAQWDAQTK